MSDNIFFHWSSTNTIGKRIESFKEGYRRNIALLGNRSRIDYIRYKYLSTCFDNEMIIYVNTSYIGGKELFSNIAHSLLSRYLKSHDSLDKMISAASYIIPSTTSFIKKTLKNGSPISFLKPLELINKFINETSNRCILILDEFTELRRIFKNFHQDFSKFIIFQNKCMIIMTSSSISLAKKMLSSELNFLFGNFEHIDLNENAYIENYFYFKKLLYPIKPTPMFMSFFADIMGENTSYFDIIAKEIKKYYNDDESDCIKKVLKHNILKEESYFFQRFIARVDVIKGKFKNYVVPLEIIMAISNGYMRRKEIASLNITKERDVLPQLNKLSELNYISNNGDVYSIKDVLFSFWLSHVFSYYFYPITMDITARERLFDAKLEETIDIFRDTYLKDATERITDLITTFKDDYLKMRKQRIRLPHIDKTKVFSYPDKRFNFLVGEGKEIIFIGIKEDTADDNDIIDYIEKTQAFKNKKVKRIFITLNGLSTSARIIAKENRLIAWDVNDINDLLRIYRKPVIINENNSNIGYPYLYDKE